MQKSRPPDKTENYYWLVTVSLDGQPIKGIFLSNDNLATSDSKDSLVHVVEQAQVSGVNHICLEQLWNIWERRLATKRTLSDG